MTINSKIILSIAALMLLTQSVTHATRDWYQEVKFTWSRTFHAPIVLTVSDISNAEKARLRVEIYSGKGGYDWGTPQVQVRELSKKQMQEILRRFEAIDFAEIYKGYQDGGADGSGWTLEYTRLGTAMRYYFWSPTSTNTHGKTSKKEVETMIAFAKYVLSVAQIEIPEDEFY